MLMLHHSTIWAGHSVRTGLSKHYGRLDWPTRSSAEQERCKDLCIWKPAREILLSSLWTYLLMKTKTRWAKKCKVGTSALQGPVVEEQSRNPEDLLPHGLMVPRSFSSPNTEGFLSAHTQHTLCCCTFISTKGHVKHTLIGYSN